MVRQRGYFETRLSHDPRRAGVWKAVAAYLEGRVPIGPEDRVLDVGAGYCDFINQVRAGERHAADLDPAAGRFAGEGVSFHAASSTDLKGVPESHFDVVFVSNLLEHLNSEEIASSLDSFLRVLKPGGRLVVVQPNFRDCWRSFYDDFTHKTPLTHGALADFIASRGFELERVQARFLPFSIKSRLPACSWMVALYLRSPLKPFSGQCLLIAKKP